MCRVLARRSDLHHVGHINNVQEDDASSKLSCQWNGSGQRTIRALRKIHRHQNLLEVHADPGCERRLRAITPPDSIAVPSRAPASPASTLRSHAVNSTFIHTVI